jgi:hypothetical protein
MNAKAIQLSCCIQTHKRKQDEIIWKKLRKTIRFYFVLLIVVKHQRNSFPTHAFISHLGRSSFWTRTDLIMLSTIRHNWTAWHNWTNWTEKAFTKPYSLCKTRSGVCNESKSKQLRDESFNLYVYFTWSEKELDKW